MFHNLLDYKTQKKGFFAVWGSIIGVYVGLFILQIMFTVAYFAILSANGKLVDGMTIPYNVQLYSTTCAIISVMIFAFCIHKWKKEDMGLRFDKRGLWEYLWGTGIGFILLSLSIVPAFMTRTMEFTKASLTASSYVVLFTYVVGYIIQSFSEEFLFRAYIMKRLSQKYNIIFVLIAQAIIFGLAHAGNSGVSFMGLFNICIIGFLFGQLLLITNNVMLVSGMHFAWNFAQGCIYGIQVSGTETTLSIFECQVVSMNSIWTGGAFGIEASITATILFVIACILCMPKTIKVIKEKTPVETQVPEATKEIENV